MKIRHEINIIYQSIDSNSDISQKIYLDTTKFSGTCYYYFEVVASGDTGYTATASLYNSNGASERLIELEKNSDIKRYRSVSFTPDNSYKEKYVYCPHSGGTYMIYAARIIIIQDTSINDLTACESQFEVGDYNADIWTSEAIEALPYPKYWYFDSAKWDGTITAYAECTWQCLNDKEWLSIYLQEDDGSFGNWTTAVQILNQGANEAVSLTRSASFTLTSGRNYRLAIQTEGDKAGYGVNIFNAKIIIQQTDATEITLLEPQMLLVNTGKGATGLQNYDQLWDDDEWDGVDLNILPEHDASQAASNTKIQEDPNGTPSDVSNSSITGANRVRGGTALSITDDETIDTNIVAI